MTFLELGSIVCFLLACAASMNSAAIAVLFVALAFILGWLSVQIAEVKGEIK